MTEIEIRQRHPTSGQDDQQPSKPKKDNTDKIKLLIAVSLFTVSAVILASYFDLFSGGAAGNASQRYSSPEELRAAGYSDAQIDEYYQSLRNDGIEVPDNP